MQNHQITPKTASAARKKLGLSQAFVARETGLNRSYLSDFESGKRVLESRWLDKLLELYLSHGWKPETAEISKDAGSESEADQDQSTVDGFPVADGFVIAGQVIDGEIEDLLDEYYSNAELLNQEMERELPRRFLGGLNDADACSACLDALIISARQDEIVQRLHGRYTPESPDIDPKNKESIRTVGDYLSILKKALVSGELYEKEREEEVV